MTRHPFAYPGYRAYWAARLSTTIAQNAMVVVIGWQVYDIARLTMPPAQAALRLAMIGVAQFVPLLLLTLVTGWVADRVDRRWVARIAVLLELACAASLALMAWHGTTTLPALFVIAALLGVARAFAGPALSALAPNLVPADALPTAIALSSIAWQSGAILGPAAGGYLYAASHWLPYGVSTALFLLAFLALMLVPRVPPTALDRRANPWRQMVEGLHYVRRNRLVLGAISLDLFAVLLGGATAALPIFARDILMVGSEGLGHLRAAPAVGSAIMAFWFSFRPMKRNVGVKMLAAVIVFGVATIVFGLARDITMPIFGPRAIGTPFGPAMIVSIVSLALLGAADMVSVYVRQSLIQLYTPDAMRGRVGAVSSLFISGSNELGEAETGAVAALVGPVAGVVAGGVGAILVVLAWWRWFPELAAARTFDPPATLENVPGETGLAQAAREEEIAR
ncbi:MAG: MFS transporter [Sphingomonas sp.]